MNVLQDKKKLALIGGIAAVVIIGIVVAVLFATGVLGPGQQSSDNTTASAPPAPVPPAAPAAGVPGAPVGGAAPGAPGLLGKAKKPLNPVLAAKTAQNTKKAALAKQKLAKNPALPPKTATPVVPGTPGAAPGTPAGAPGAKVAAATSGNPDPDTVPDPFKLPKVDTGQVQQTRRYLDGVPPIPSPVLTNWRPHAAVAETPTALPTMEPSSAGRRMAGVLFGDGVYAVLETNGKTETVQPGDSVEGGKVVSIEADGLTIKTDDDRIIKVPLSSTPTGNQTAGAGFAPAGYPGMNPNPYARGGNSGEGY